MLKEKVNEIIEEVEVLENYMKEMFNVNDLLEADDSTIKLLRSYINLMNLSKELMMAQAEVTDNMNDKLDKILEKLEG